MAEGNGRISVSHDTLRAELAQLELRLIKSLVPSSALLALEKRVDRLEEEALTPSQIESQFGKMFQSHRARGFKTWEMVAGAMIIVLGLAGFVLNVYTATQ